MSKIWSVLVAYHSAVPFWVCCCPCHTQSSSYLCRRSIFPEDHWTSQLIPSRLHSHFSLIQRELSPLLFINISKCCVGSKNNANLPSRVIFLIVAQSLTKRVPFSWSMASQEGTRKLAVLPTPLSLPKCPLPANTLTVPWQWWVQSE